VAANYLFLFLFSFLSFTLQAREKPPLDIWFLDVGQGDAAYLQLPSGKNALIDGGPGASEYDPFDAGKEVIIPFLESLGVEKIDFIVASHAHLDHIGGLIPVMERFQIGTVYDTGFEYPSYAYDAFLETIKNKKIKYAMISSGKKLDWDPSLKIEIIGPPEKLFIGGSDCNDNSLIMKVSYGKISFMFTGDAEKRAELSAANKYGDKLTSTILKVGHHGSETSSTTKFLTHVFPEVAIIECGRNNRFGHPHRSTVKRLEKFGARIYRTDTNGTIKVRTDGKKYWILK